mmetsp:Transcript_110892/g.313684  ORF Transcript_110892/g.313684 Transcript_110892/m.313684 type:complete len:253 (+) Transcript_110892:651-1409(+)
MARSLEPVQELRAQAAAVRPSDDHRSLSQEAVVVPGRILQAPVHGLEGRRLQHVGRLGRLGVGCERKALGDEDPVGRDHGDVAEVALGRPEGHAGRNEAVEEALAPLHGQQQADEPVLVPRVERHLHEKLCVQARRRLRVLDREHCLLCCPTAIEPADVHNAPDLVVWRQGASQAKGAREPSGSKRTQLLNVVREVDPEMLPGLVGADSPMQPDERTLFWVAQCRTQRLRHRRWGLGCEREARARNFALLGR